MTSQRRVVYLGGTWDILNWGHVKAMQMCKTFGNYLIIGLNTNELVKQFKNRDCVLPYYQKEFILQSIKYVDEVIPVETFSPMEILKRYNVDVYCLTHEWENSKTAEIDYIQSKGGEIQFLPRFEGVVCTSDIKKILLNEAKAEAHEKSELLFKSN